MVNILYAEDDQDDVLFFREALNEVAPKAKLTIAKNGVELMELLRNPVDYDILFLDINMPIKNGIECLKEIRADEKLKDMIVVILATSRSYKSVKEGHTHGANLYIPKPINLKQWNTVIEKSLSLNYNHYRPYHSFEKFVLMGN